jgi:hypothetical protein
VLSRIAEALYWMGRYLERADATARLLDVHVHRVIAQAGEDAGGESLLIAMGLEAEELERHRDEHGGVIDLWQAVELLAYDAANPSSVVGSLRLARENARGLREVLATEVWEALNRTHHELDNHVRAARTLGPHLLFQWVRDRVALVGGLADSVLLHDDGWRFLTVGRCLERVDMTARLLGAVPAGADASRWSGVLVSCGANDAFLRTYGGEIDTAQGAVGAAARPRLPSVGALRPRPSRAVPAAGGGRASHPRHGRGQLPRASAAAMEVGRIRADLAYSDPVLLAHDLPSTIARLQAACAHASEMVSQRYFQRVTFIEWNVDQPA